MYVKDGIKRTNPKPTGVRFNFIFVRQNFK
jgi:hypothetical protein